MHIKHEKAFYTSLLRQIDSRLRAYGFTVKTQFNNEEKVFTIKNIHVKSEKEIYIKNFGYREESQKDALIVKAYKEYIMDMMYYGIQLNHESYLVTSNE